MSVAELREHFTAVLPSSGSSVLPTSSLTLFPRGVGGDDNEVQATQSLFFDQLPVSALTVAHCKEKKKLLHPRLS